MLTALPIEASKPVDGKPRLLDSPREIQVVLRRFHFDSFGGVISRGEVRAVARMRHLSIRTEQAYVNWIHPVR